MLVLVADWSKRRLSPLDSDALTVRTPQGESAHWICINNVFVGFSNVDCRGNDKLHCNDKKAPPVRICRTAELPENTALAPWPCASNFTTHSASGAILLTSPKYLLPSRRFSSIARTSEYFTIHFARKETKEGTKNKLPSATAATTSKET